MAATTYPDDPDKYRGVTPLSDCVALRGLEKKNILTLFAAQPERGSASMA